MTCDDRVDGLAQQLACPRFVEHALFGRQPGLEGKALQEAAAHAVDGADARGTDRHRAVVVALLDEEAADALTQFRRGAVGEGGRQHACGSNPTPLEFLEKQLGQPVCLAAAGSSADETDTAAHCPAPQPARRT